MAAKPGIPKGTRDFSPVEMAKRNYIFNTIRDVYHLYGFQQIETPAMEMLSTLMGKYGEEGDKLLFKILDSGDFLTDFDENEREKVEELLTLKNQLWTKCSSNQSKTTLVSFLLEMRDTTSEVGLLFEEIILKELLFEGLLLSDKQSGYDIGEGYSLAELKKAIKHKTGNLLNTILKNKIIAPNVGREKGLRYDLTVPFARYVVMHRDEITFPFKRYQIQPVWRADRPQKGRYREFYQCDADVVGSDSLLNEVELMQIVDTVFTRLGIRVCIKINNRKILTGIAEIIGEADKIVDITVAIDKLDKIGLDNVNAELKEKGISDEAIAKLQPIILLNGTNEEKLATLKEVLAGSEIGQKGVEESEFILKTLSVFGLKNELELDLTLARGLNYYTGAIFEVKALDVQIGSITGGGRRR